MGDRGGGREAKGTSLKKSKKNPGSTVAKQKKAPSAKGSVAPTSLPPAPPGSGQYFDAGCALLSRQFDRDRERVCLRAKEDGLSAVLVWFSDVDKQQVIADTCKANLGLCYGIVGVHPDNIDRMNKKSHEDWLEKIEELGRRSEIVGILSGLNLSRETGTHFAQETLLKAHRSLAEKLLLPLVLHVASDGASIERAIDVLREDGWCEEGSGLGDGSKRVLLHDALTACNADVAKIDLVARSGMYCVLSGSGITDSSADTLAKASQCLSRIPLQQMLTCSDAPWRTPQNLADPYLCTLRNEPSNIYAVNQAIADIRGVPPSDMAAALKENALKVFGMEFISEDQLTVSEIAAEMTRIGISAKSKAPSADNEEEEEREVGGARERKKDRKKSARAQEAASVPGADADEGLAVEQEQEQGAESAEESEEEEQEEGAFYGCPKCRSRLFSQQQLHSHGIDSVRSAVFKVGDEGLCSSALFLRCKDSIDVSTSTGIRIKGNNAQCDQCGVKLGKYSVGECACPCGAAVEGPAVKITTSKVDFFDGSADMSALTARALLEAQEAQKQDLVALAEDELSKLSKKSHKKKLKIVSSRGAGNFSNFRNKSFIPNASRVGKRALVEGEDNEDEDHDEDDDEEA